MRLVNYGRSVVIDGESVSPNSWGEKAEIKMSILQLAKIWGTDRISVSEVEDSFGSDELEDKCDETREEVKKFPDFEFWNKEIKIEDVSVSSDKNNKINVRGKIFADGITKE